MTAFASAETGRGDDRRPSLEPAYLLHHRPFRDSSLILDVFTREHGRLSLVARGSRGGKSRLKGILRPFLPLRLSWSIKTDLGTLTGAEAAGPPAVFQGETLLSGFYLNELLLIFLHRHDPQPEIFELYSASLEALAGTSCPARELRVFEIELLRLLGYALDLATDAATGEPVADDVLYEYRADRGPVRADGREAGRVVCSGARLKSVAALELDDPETLRIASRLLRMAIDYHLGGRELKSRKVLIALRRDRMRDPAGQPAAETTTHPATSRKTT